MHAARTRAAKFTPKRMSAFVDEVLAMRPLPRRVVHLWDLAYLHGHPADYAVCSLEIKDFYFPAEPSNPNDRPAPWRIKVEETRGATCTFLYDRQGV